ncbi:hypothetical protein EVAR_81504_1 [Eumeta japonica]|uniref:Uncharacterized protein n=1 Tax=Eumeta variegata TaxID=151549 RepID=A0A4C1VZQ3_EUMVA|nr:hypothetical protein EVAR_81504_1 [Eumeta japonica]
MRKEVKRQTIIAQCYTLRRDFDALLNGAVDVYARMTPYSDHASDKRAPLELGVRILNESETPAVRAEP